MQLCVCVLPFMCFFFSRVQVFLFVFNSQDIVFQSVGSYAGSTDWGGSQYDTSLERSVGEQRGNTANWSVIGILIEAGCDHKSAQQGRKIQR